MKKKLSIILCLIPIILSSLTFELEKIDEFAESGDYGVFHRLLTEDNYLYAISHYGFEINAVDENGELIRISLIPIEGDVDGIMKIDTIIFVSVSTLFNRQGEIHSTLYKIDVSNPYEPYIVDSIIFPENIKNSTIGTYGDYLGYHKLEEINNSWFVTQLVFMDPITFEEITSYIIHTGTYQLKENYFMQKRNLNEYIYDIYDYSDIYNIHVVSSVDFESCPTVYMTIYAIDDSTLVLLGNESISFYDFSDISNIELLSTHYKHNEVSPLGDCIRIDDFLLIPSQGAGIEVVDISDLANPVMFNFWEYPIEELALPDPNFLTTGGLIYNNGHLYVGTFYHGIILMNFNNGTIEYVNHFINNRVIRPNVQINNNYLFTTVFSGGLYVYDLEEVVSPTLNMIIFEDLYVIDFEIINNYIYLTTHSHSDGNSYFKVFDISDLSNPILQLDELLNGLSFLLINENESDYIYICSLVNMQFVEICKYDISDPGNIEQVLLFEYPGIVQPSFFYEGYLYIEEYDEDGMKNLLIYGGFEEENPELVNQFTNFIGSAKIDKINNYLYLSQNGNVDGDLFYSLDDPINPEFAFSIPNSSKWAKSYFKDNVLFSPSRFSVYIYDLEDNPSGELEPFDHFNLNSRYNNMTFYSQGVENYFFCEQLECISTYNYSIETSADDELAKPEFTLSNYPNPFNPETTISFFLTTEITEDTELTIYNIKGQKVRTFIVTLSPESSLGKGSDNNYVSTPSPSTTLRMTQAGSKQYSVIWDGTDSNNKLVSSGVYMYQLKVNGKAIASKKCLLLK